MCKKVFILLVVGLLVNVAYPVTLVNPSFELPGTDKQNCWDGGTNAKGTFVDVPGWSSDTMAADSGVETGWNATDGEWTGFIKGNDPSVWQLTDYVIGAYDVLMLQIDAANNWAATTLRLTIYYDDAGARVPAASVDVELTDSMATYSMTFVAADAPDSIGKLLGIELDNVTEEGESWIGIDNVRLGSPSVGLIHSYTFDDGTANDSVGEAHGTLVGGAEIIDGAMVTTAQDQWMQMPGDVIGVNSYDAITIEAWYTPTAGANEGWSMLAYLGGSSEPNIAGVGINGYFITTARADDMSRAGISTGSAEPWADETNANGVEYDDGLLHHMVSTLSADEITLYIDGVLQASTPMDPHNSIHDLSNDYVLLAKGGYGGDPEWIGAIHEFNIYDKALSAEEIAALYAGIPLPTHTYTFEDGTADDSVGEAHGSLVGGAEVVGGAMVTSAQDQWMEMPGDVIAMNTYSGVTVEAWYTPEAGANTSWTMLAYFGDSTDPNVSAGVGNDGFFITSARGDDVSRAAISIGNPDAPYASESGANGPEYDDGLLHHMVSTIDDVNITLYIDGELQASTPLDPNNVIAGISTNYALLAKGGYGSDPEWIGAIDEFNIYNTALSAEEIAALYAAGPLKVGPQPVDPGTDGLVAYYPLDAAYRGSTPDASGNGNDGAIMGDPAFVEGVVAQAIDLDGDGDYIDCGAAEIFGMQETNAMTAAAWVTIRSIPAAWSAVVAKGEYAWRISNANMDPRFHFGITIWNAPDTFGTDGVIAVGYDEWHHVAGTFDGATISLYVDGVLDINVPTTEPIGANEASVLIGENPESAGRYWDGLIDEVILYNRALSMNEVLFLAQ
jgi:hypothetical protein